MVNRLKSDFLIAAPSFVSGAARLLDWAGLYDTYNGSRNGQEADAKALFSDWRVVGQDIDDAMVEFEATQPVK
ncbi:MAG: hypothetical protein WA172_00925 [Terriglobales bacterium]